MPVYSVDKLMSETRRLAAQYHESTGQTLPVTQELSRYDVKHLLQLQEPKMVESGVDALADWSFAEKIQIKGRVIFNEEKTKQRIGQLNMEGHWQGVALILYDAHYQPQAIHLAIRAALEEVTEQQKSSNKRGLLSVAKFKAIGRLVWSAQQGLVPESLLADHSKHE